MYDLLLLGLIKERRDAEASSMRDGVTKMEVPIRNEVVFEGVLKDFPEDVSTSRIQSTRDILDRAERIEQSKWPSDNFCTCKEPRPNWLSFCVACGRTIKK